MEIIAWSERYDVGVEVLNEQHKRLIKMVNSLIENKEDSGNRAALISDIINQMAEYAAKHFKSEEELMNKYNYPGYAMQQKQHATFRIKIGDISNKFASYGDDIPEEDVNKIISYLLEWLMDHILTSDMQYKTFFNEKGVY
ncbi:bacteriohemerythrin [Candidatus Omnitrophota bacterium]